MSDDERPVHLEVNCSTGTVVHTELDDQEWAALRARGVQAAAGEQQRAAADAALRAAVAAHPDPVFRDFAARFGLLPQPNEGGHDVTTDV